MPLQDKGENNTISIAEGVTVTGQVVGNDNVVEIGPSERPMDLNINIQGDRNRLYIGLDCSFKQTKIAIGNHVPAHEVEVSVGSKTTFEGACALLAYNSGSVIRIGEDCMMSNNIIFRAGESPHLIFDDETGEYLDVTDGLFIGNHVWVGERAYVTKRVTIPDNCIVAACSVVTRRFETERCVLAGNPAKIVREGVRWIRNRGHLEKGSKYHDSYARRNSPFARDRSMLELTTKDTKA